MARNKIHPIAMPRSTAGTDYTYATRKNRLVAIASDTRVRRGLGGIRSGNPGPSSDQSPQRRCDCAWATQVQQHPVLLRQIANAVGGSLHVLYRAPFTTNKEGCWPMAPVQIDCGVDVANAPGPVDVMAQGIRGQDLVVAGPAKTAELFWLAVRHRAAPTSSRRSIDIPEHRWIPDGFKRIGVPLAGSTAIKLVVATNNADICGYLA